RKVQVYDLVREKIVSSFQAHFADGFSLKGLAFDPGSKILYTAGTEGKAPNPEDCWKAWEAPTGRLLHSQKLPIASANTLAVSPDGRGLATGGSGDGKVRLWTVPKDLGQK